MRNAQMELYQKLDKLSIYSLSLTEEAEKVGWHYDPEVNKWFMINTRLDVRQYLDSLNEAFYMNGNRWGDPKFVYLKAFQTSHYMAGRDSWYDSADRVYKKYTEDMLTNIDNYTGGIFSKVMSFIPGANISMPLMKSLSKFFNALIF